MFRLLYSKKRFDLKEKALSKEGFEYNLTPTN